MNFIRQRSASLSMVVFMLFIIALLKGSIVSWLEHGFWPDALPLTRRVKMLMLLQSTISIITLTSIASSAINIMVGVN